MKKLILFTTLFIIGLSPVLAQSISNVVVSRNGDKIFYLKDNDSLFVRELNGKHDEIFVDDGLKDNGNQRLLKWAADSSYLTYEKKGRLKIFDLRERSSKIIPNETIGTLTFFRWFLTRQTSVDNRNNLYFSAGVEKAGKSAFQLFKLNVRTSELKQLTDLDTDASNVSVSPSGDYVAFSTYQYVDSQPESVIHILAAGNENEVFRSDEYKNTFFTDFRWSPNGRFLLAKVDGGAAKLFTFSLESRELRETKLPLGFGENPIDFYDDAKCVFSKMYEKDIRKIGLVNIESGTKETVIEENAGFIGLIRKRSRSLIMYVTESGIDPKTIWQTDPSDRASSRKIKILSFADKNPLAKYAYTTYWYKNNVGGLTSSYIYFPSAHLRSKKKYSLLILPYGGYSDNYPDLGYFLYRNLFTYLDAGFIIALPNTRGINSERQVSDYGKTQLEDTTSFIKEIGPKYNIDDKRIFVLGHSHGAAMVFYYLTHSDIFAGGIAVNGAADWIKQADRKSMSGLPFGMGGAPTELNEKYLQSSPLENIGNLKSPLLLFAGKKDAQIPYDINSEAFQKKAAEIKKSVKLVLFDEEGHLIEKPNNRATLWNEITIFLKRPSKK